MAHYDHNMLLCCPLFFLILLHGDLIGGVVALGAAGVALFLRPITGFGAQLQGVPTR